MLSFSRELQQQQQQQQQRDNGSPGNLGDGDCVLQQQQQERVRVAGGKEGKKKKEKEERETISQSAREASERAVCVCVLPRKMERGRRSRETKKGVRMHAKCCREKEREVQLLSRLLRSLQPLLWHARRDQQQERMQGM